MYYGGELLHGTRDVSTTRQGRCHNPRWDEWLGFGFEMARLPRATRLCITLHRYTIQPLVELYGLVVCYYDQLCITLHSLQTYKGQTETRPVGWVNLQLFDDASRLRTGKIPLRLWPRRVGVKGEFFGADAIGTFLCLITPLCSYLCGGLYGGLYGRGAYNKVLSARG
jgi:hypothetical protein